MPFPHEVQVETRQINGLKITLLRGIPTVNLQNLKVLPKEHLSFRQT